MDKLRKFFEGKDKKTINTNLAIITCVGIILLIMSTTLFNNDTEEELVSNDNILVDDSISFTKNPKSYEALLESRLEEIFREVEGVGDVKVMLTLTHGKEIIIAEDIKSNESRTIETDSGGGTREVTNSSLDSSKIIISGRNGENKPLVLKEVQPRVEGVVIIAEGGGDVAVRSALIEATRTVLGVEAHRVNVLQMRNEN